MLEFPAIAKLGGRPKAHEKLKLIGFSGTLNAMSMWRVRRSIPGDATRLLMQAAESEGVYLRSDDFEIAELPEAQASA